jgi:hypothetical protein
MEPAGLWVIVGILAIPAVCAVIAYRRDNRGGATVWNALLPALLLLAGAVSLATNSLSDVTLEGVLDFLVPLTALVACAAGWLRREAFPWLFWVAWGLNLATLVAIGYLALAFQNWHW